MPSTAKKQTNYTPREEEKRYYAKAPQKGKKSWVLVCYYLEDGNRKKRVYVPLTDDIKAKVEAINLRLLAGSIDDSEVKTLLDDLIQRQYSKYAVQARAVRDARLSEINNKAFNAYWNGHYALKTKTKDKASPRHDIKKALSLIEPLSLYTAEKHELEQKVIDNASSMAKAARAISRLNEMLSWMGRTNGKGGKLKLEAPNVPKRDIQYCTEIEFKQILVHVEDENLKLFASVLFGAGLRIGEALALDQDSLRRGILNIKRQVDKAGDLVDPKKGSAGQVVVVPNYLPAVEQWIEVDNKEQYRYTLYDALYTAVRIAFPKGPNRRWVGPHDLRHAHAIHLLENGAAMTQVAQNLRNSLKVCQEYYAGFAHTDGTIELLKKTLGA